MLSSDNKKDSKYYIFNLSSSDYIKLNELIFKENKIKNNIRERKGIVRIKPDLKLYEITLSDYPLILPEIILKNEKEWIVIIKCPFCTKFHNHITDIVKNPECGIFKAECDTNKEYELLFNMKWQKEIDNLKQK